MSCHVQPSPLGRAAKAVLPSLAVAVLAPSTFKNPWDRSLPPAVFAPCRYFHELTSSQFPHALLYWPPSIGWLLLSKPHDSWGQSSIFGTSAPNLASHSRGASDIDPFHNV
eukprot:CAMPEP_0195029998 /NCGR_PEP_ID=MMETSP0326_2-20130528/57957_1 /TAXON_ID=2866 ORGANISM="Crypthecodinium cohnii, Strain Seligo" /NCGR_SAMPLE_ID=MMETSP0326_2 /ASSEMBLY_ACC=CAM_ASM_000348 /LENGTH=110 /DNA_ID=CAMNT_0040053129 /DNA_START=54 /DNA_END=383 /DNA_ORIENTATION=-